MLTCAKHGWENLYTECPICTEFNHMGCTYDEEFSLQKMCEFLNKKLLTDIDKLNQERDTQSIVYANLLTKQTKTLPNGVINPGAWFGFQAGWDAAVNNIQHKHTPASVVIDTNPPIYKCIICGENYTND